MAIVFLSPITGIMKCATSTVDLILEFTEMDSDELLSEEADEFLEFSDDFMVCAVDACGGKMWFNLSTSTRCNGQWTNINKEIAFFSNVGMEELTEIMESISELDDDSIDTLEDFLEQLHQLKKMGNLEQLIGMIPGAGALKDVQVDEKHMKRIEAIILSMTKKERTYPDIINGSRRKRIAKGCGLGVEDVNRLLKQFEQMKKMMKQLSGKNARKMFGRRMGF
jgi:hypothetical protein